MEYRWEDLLTKLLHDFGDTSEVRQWYKDMENMMNPTGWAPFIIHPLVSDWYWRGLDPNHFGFLIDVGPDIAWANSHKPDDASNKLAYGVEGWNS